MQNADDTIERKKAATGERRRIQSVAVGFRLVRALEAHGRPMSLTQLATAADMPTSQAHLYLSSYVHEGLVRQDAATSRYALGPYALQLGLAAMRALDVVALAREEIELLRDRSQESAHFSVWTERGPCIVLNVDGARPLPFSSRIGFVLPLLGSATGQAFLTYLRRTDTERLLKGEAMPARRRGDGDRAAEVEAIVNNVRSRGYACTDSQVNIGLTALAAPVFDHADAICGVLTLIGPSGAFGTEPDSPTVAALLASTRRLTARLSGTAA